MDAATYNRLPTSSKVEPLGIMPNDDCFDKSGVVEEHQPELLMMMIVSHSGMLD